MLHADRVVRPSQAPTKEPRSDRATSPVDFTQKLPPEVLDLVAQSTAAHQVLHTFASINVVSRQVARSWQARSLAQALQTGLREVSAANSAELHHLGAGTQSTSAQGHRTAFATYHAVAYFLQMPAPLARPTGVARPDDWSSLNEASRVVRMSLCQAARAPGQVQPGTTEALRIIGAALTVPCVQWAQRHMGGRVAHAWFGPTVEIGPILGRYDVQGQWLHQLPPLLWYSQAITTVTLDANRFTEVPDALAQLPGLTHLSMTNNLLTGLPAWMAQCHALTTLYLTDNNFAEVPDVVWQLPRLRDLHFKANDLQHLALPPRVHQTLEVLRLDFNHLPAMPAGLPERLPNLLTLGLAHTGLRAFPPDFTHFNSLELLDLSGLSLVMPQALIEHGYLGRLMVERGDFYSDSEDGLPTRPPEGFEALDFEMSDEEL